MVSKKILLLVLILISFSVKASFILLPMDETTQQNHLKAYGITYWCIDKKYKASWLLNYRGGSNAKEIKNAVEQCIQFVDADINVKIRDTLTDVN